MGLNAAKQFFFFLASLKYIENSYKDFTKDTKIATCKQFHIISLKIQKKKKVCFFLLHFNECPCGTSHFFLPEDLFLYDRQSLMVTL